MFMPWTYREGLLAIGTGQGSSYESLSDKSEGRLLVLSFFGDKIRRITASQGILRNDMVAALAEAILVPHASKN